MAEAEDTAVSEVKSRGKGKMDTGWNKALG